MNFSTLTSKISKPAISSTPMKCCLFCLVSRVSLHFLTKNLNNLSNMALDMAPTEYDTWLTFLPWVTNSLPTLILGLTRAVYKAWASTPNSLATFSPSYEEITLSKKYIDRLFTYRCAIGFGLFFATSLLEFHGTHVHYGGGDLVDVVLFFLGETKNVEGLLYFRNAYSLIFGIYSVTLTTIIPKLRQRKR